MRFKKHIILITVGVLLLSLLAVGSAIAKGPADHLEAIDVGCTVEVGDGFVKINGITTSDDLRLNGTSEIIVTPSVGKKLDLLATFTIDNEMYQGTWVLPGHSADVEPATVVHQGYGTGDFAGLRMQLTGKIIEPIADPPCPPAGPTVKLKAVILD